MTKNIWLISDTHFDQESMLTFHDWTGKQTRPGFRDVNHMNELMMDNWNSVVKPGDIVIHQGDVVGGPDPQAWMENNWHLLNGEKHLIVGNHDNIKMLVQGNFFSEINLWKPYPEFGLLLTHVPLHRGSLLRPKIETDGDTPINKDDTRLWAEAVNVHGHIHSNPSPDGPYRCVCVEQPPVNYTPINIEEVRIK